MRTSAFRQLTKANLATLVVAISINGSLYVPLVSAHSPLNNHPQCNGLWATRWVDAGHLWSAAAGGAGAHTDLGVYSGTINGTNGSDVIVGSSANDTINGDQQGDTICGLGGNDTIDGGSSGDWIDGGAGDDTIQGGTGTDTIFGGDGDDDIFGDQGGDAMTGGAGNDFCDQGTGPGPACEAGNNEGVIIIIKDSSPNHAQDFIFTAESPLASPFSLDDDADGTLSNTRQYNNVAIGNLDVTESVTGGWSLTGLNCTIGGVTDPQTTVDLGGRVAHIDIDEGDIVTCTYTNTQVVICGDGIIAGAEVCDDGNTTNGDGCSSVCAVQSGWSCTGQPSVCSTTCGDSIEAGTEQCDDGNVTNTDACTNACTDAVCGDTITRTGFEQCDDGNATNTDSCTNICENAVCGDGFAQTPNGEQCDDANVNNNDACTNACQTALCGDSIVGPGETCDDGNTSDADGCSALCAIEHGYVCTGEASSCAPVCGDGLVANVEACDDGNTDNADGCSATCTLEDGWMCENVPEPSMCESICGDGMVLGGEECDDNNTSAGDGCSAICAIESGWVCSGEPSSCSTVCGDGIMTGFEGCDDGNTSAGDGCNAICQLESCGNGVTDSGEECDDANASNNDACVNNCQSPSCGDGFNWTGEEQCDDGNGVGDDGCSALCAIEHGYACEGEPSDCASSCGDGLVADDEQCDDGNTSDGDGCSEVCSLEDGWMCELEPSICATSCGDGIEAGSETCDDGNLASGDSCSDVCKAEICGDKIVDAGESCDDGNEIEGDGCSNACQSEFCGNGVLNFSESCDDGNASSGDGCSSSCSIEACGNEVIDSGESCDDGNTTSFDGCDSICNTEVPVTVAQPVSDEGNSNGSFLGHRDRETFFHAVASFANATGQPIVRRGGAIAPAGQGGMPDFSAYAFDLAPGAFGGSDEDLPAGEMDDMDQKVICPIAKAMDRMDNEEMAETLAEAMDEALGMDKAALAAILRNPEKACEEWFSARNVQEVVVAPAVRPFLVTRLGVPYIKGDVLFNTCVDPEATVTKDIVKADPHGRTCGDMHTGSSWNFIEPDTGEVVYFNYNQPRPKNGLVVPKGYFKKVIDLTTKSVMLGTSQQN